MTAPDRLHRFGPFVLDVADRRLVRNGVDVPLRARAFDVLVALVERAGRLVTKDELLDAVWAELAVEENNLQVQVSALRRQLGTGWITTVPGRGYRFTGVPPSPASAPAVRVAAAHAGGLGEPPEPATPLVGRDAEFAAVRALLAAERFVTLIGPGGVGKTRLAQAVVRATRGELAEATVWVDLAAIQAPDLVLAGTAAALGVPPAATGAEEALVAALARSSTLLVFDNAEHVAESVGPLAVRLLARIPTLHVLVTSQAPCRVAAEHLHRLGALEVPDAGADVAHAEASTAVALFTARARSLVGDFRLDAENVATVIEICRAVDGIPLALELAAGRLPAFGLRGLAARLAQRFRVLTGGDRAGPARQQTLEALYEWSYGLLDETEQAVFRRVGLLAATFPIEDVLALATESLPEEQLVETLAELVDRSLVNAGGGDPPFYSLLETGRAYARAKVDPALDAEPLARAIDLHRSRALAAATRSENAGALAAATAALDLITRLAPGAERDTRELDLCLALGPVFQTTLGPAHARAEQIYRRATRLADGQPPGESGFMALWGLWHFLSMAGRDREAAERAAAIVRLAEVLGEEGLLLEAHHARLTSAQLLGDAPGVVACARIVVSAYERERHHGLGSRFGGHDPGVCALGQGAVGLWLTGRPAEAIEWADRALDLGAVLGHSYSHAVALFYASFTFQGLGRTDRFRECAEALYELCAHSAMDMLSNEALLLRGRARHDAGDTSGIVDMARALDTIDAGGDYAFAIYYATLLAEALLTEGRDDEAARRLARVDEYAREGQRFLLAEAWRLRAVIQARAGRELEASRARAEAARIAGACGAVALAGRIGGDPGTTVKPGGEENSR